MPRRVKRWSDSVIKVVAARFSARAPFKATGRSNKPIQLCAGRFVGKGRGY